jgi:hypothetical protein
MEDREAIHDEEREAVITEDDVEGHLLSTEERDVAATGDEREANVPGD